jgi:hypothetical protein
LTKGEVRVIFSKIPLSRLSEAGKEKREFHADPRQKDGYPHPKCGLFFEHHY